MKLILLLILVFLCSCRDIASQVEEQRSTIEISGSSSVILPEPLVKGEKVRFKLTDLSVTEEKLLKIDDSILFTGLKNQPSLKNVTLEITSHCILNANQVIAKKFKRDLTPEIPLIEILPEAILLSYEKDSNPSCGFSFTAKNKEGSAHHFELPQLPIIDHLQKSHLIKIIPREGGVLNSAFPYIQSKDIYDYWLDTGALSQKINFIKLSCSHFTLPLPVLSQQFVPINIFPFDQIADETKKTINKQAPQQACRFLAYTENNVLGAVSSLFYIVYPFKGVHVSLEDDLYEDKEQAFFSNFIDEKKEPSSNKNDLHLFSYEFKNYNKYPISFFIKNTDSSDFKMNIYGLYYYNNTAFYRLKQLEEGFDFSINRIRGIKGSWAQSNITDGVFIELQPGAEIKIPVIIKPNELRFCNTVKDPNKYEDYFLGAVIEIPEFQAYQLISSFVDFKLLYKNILHPLNMHSGHSFHIFGKHLLLNLKKSYSKIRSNSQLHLPKQLWFRRAFCEGRIIAKAKDSLIEVSTGGRVRSDILRNESLEFIPLENTNKYGLSGYILKQVIEKQ